MSTATFVLAARTRPGEAGPFPLLTYEDVKKQKHALQIVAVTKRKYMPP